MRAPPWRTAFLKAFLKAGSAVTFGSHLLDVDDCFGDLCTSDLAEDSIPLAVIGKTVDGCRQPTKH